MLGISVAFRRRWRDAQATVYGRADHQNIAGGGDHGGQARELCRKYGIAEQTFYRWRQKYGGLEVAEAARLRQLERENGRLKKLVAERDLEVEVLKELLAKKW
jgi:putative transposase